jgi:hypothetical protein
MTSDRHATEFSGHGREGNAQLTHGGPCMALGEFAQTIAHLAVIQEDLPVRSDARKVVSTWRIPHVQGELGVGLDRLVGRREEARV